MVQDSNEPEPEPDTLAVETNRVKKSNKCAKVAYGGNDWWSNIETAMSVPSTIQSNEHTTNTNAYSMQ